MASPRPSRKAPSRPEASQPASSPGRARLAALLVFLSTLALFLPTLSNGFVNYDDPANVYATPEVTRGLSLHGVGWAFTHPVLGHWDPLTTLSHMLDCSLFGLHPWGHHLTNAVLHAAAAAFFFLALEAMTAAFWPALFAAALFAWHPLRVESVAWISERKDVLSAFFFMGALWAYAGYARKPSRRRYLGVAAWFACGLLSKSMLVTFPCVLLLLDAWPLRRLSGPLPVWKVVAEKLPLFALSLASSVVQLYTTAGMKVPISLPERVANATVGYWLYLSKFFWPSPLAVLYPRPLSWPAGEIALASAVLAAGSAVAILSRRARPYLLTGWLWFLGMLAPVIGLIQIGSQSIADRYSYLPSAGLTLILAWGASELTKTWRHRVIVLRAAASISLAACGALTVRQIGFWKDSEALFRHDLTVAPENSLPHMSLGIDLLEKGRVDEAIAQLRAALALGTDRIRAHLNLGAACYLKGLYPEALEHYQAVEQLQPELPEPHLRLAELLAHQGDLGAAVSEARAWLSLVPNDQEGRLLLSGYLRRLGRVEEAIAELKTLLQAAPENFDAHNDLGIALFEQGRLDEAVQHFREAIRLQPNHPAGHMNLALAQSSQGQTAEAMLQFREVLRLEPNSPLARQKLAALIAKTAGTEK